MKKIVAIGLLILLLYNMLGLSAAVLLFENQFKTAVSANGESHYQFLKVYVPSLPYTSSWENEVEIEGLIKNQGEFYNTTHVVHTNDTLYVTLKSNQPARDRFFELAGRMQSISDPTNQTADSPQGKALKLLDNLIKNYVQHDAPFLVNQQIFYAGPVTVIHPVREVRFTRFLLRLQTPPPELC